MWLLIALWIEIGVRCSRGSVSPLAASELISMLECCGCRVAAAAAWCAAAAAAAAASLATELKFRSDAASAEECFEVGTMSDDLIGQHEHIEMPAKHIILLPIVWSFKRKKYITSKRWKHIVSVQALTRDW